MTIDENKLNPYTVNELIRRAIAKTYFLRKGERLDKFKKEQTTCNKEFI